MQMRKILCSPSLAFDSAYVKYGVFLDLWLRNIRSGESRDYRDVIVSEKIRFQNVSRPHENTAFSNSNAVWRAFSKIKAPFFVTDCRGL